MNNKKKLINYIKDFADNIKDGNLHINDFNRFIEILKKYKKKIMCIYLVMAGAHLLHLILVWI